MAVVLSSQWAGLSKKLIATLYRVDRDGQKLAGEPEVQSPPIEGSIELLSNWNSPFENMGPESKAPATMALLQSGALASSFFSISAAASAVVGEGMTTGALAAAAQGIESLAESLGDIHGVSGMTKLNATQVFVGSAPVKIPLTLLFRAFKDPKAEVQDPIDKLAEWILPAKLSTEGTITGGIRGLATGGSLVDAFFPSRAPQYIGLQYAGYTFAPLVIESMSHPLVTPRSIDGGALSLQVQISLASVTALDSADWRRVRSNQPIAMFQTTKKP